MPTLAKLMLMQEASKHASKDDCWIVIDGKVYDVTSYLEEHPGGDDVVIEATDATDEFEEYAEKLVSASKQYWVVPAAVIGLPVAVGFLYLRRK